MSELSSIKVFVDDDKVVVEIQKRGLKKLIELIMERDLYDQIRPEEGVKDKDSGDVPWESNTDDGGETPEEHADDKEEAELTVDLFETGPNGVGGSIQDAPGGRKMISEIQAWLKDNRFNYRNFCKFLFERKYVAGWKLSKPLIGTTAKGEPTIFQVAARYYTYWKTAKDREAYLYKEFLVDQLQDLGVKTEMVKELMDGEEVDPANLPKGIEVSP